MDCGRSSDVHWSLCSERTRDANRPRKSKQSRARGRGWRKLRQCRELASQNGSRSFGRQEFTGQWTANRTCRLRRESTVSRCRSSEIEKVKEVRKQVG